MRASTYVVEIHTLNTNGATDTFDDWIREQGVNQKVYTSPENPGGAYGWAKKAWLHAIAIGGKKRLQKIAALMR